MDTTIEDDDEAFVVEEESHMAHWAVCAGERRRGACGEGCGWVYVCISVVRGRGGGLKRSLGRR